MTAKNARAKRRCARKISHPTETAAAATARRLGIGWYVCPHCHGWHVGHTPRQAALKYAARARGQAS